MEGGLALKEMKFFCVKEIKDYVRSVGNFDGVEFADSDKETFLNAVMRIQIKAQEGCEGEIYGETGIEGLKIDFNFGLRLDIPEGNWHVKVSDFDSGQIFFDEDISDKRLISLEKYYVHWQVDVSRDGEPVFSHTFDLTGQPVQVYFVAKAMGDAMALMPYVSELQKVYGCDVTVVLPKFLREFFKQLYPDLKQADKETFEFYATFYPMIAVSSLLFLPTDGRTTPMENMGSLIFGLNTVAPNAKYTPSKPRRIKEPYVCIGVQASGTPKCWLYPGGWDIVVRHLKELGYRVLCIDKDAKVTNYLHTIKKPKFAEDFTGNHPLIERADMLYYADFFIGLGSGLSWLAHSVGCKVVMICGFSRQWYEFYNPYRVINPILCNGCFNDLRVIFRDQACPYHEKTPRELECQRKIMPRQVIAVINQLIADLKEERQ